jgi:DnaK suppressor protein
MTLHSITAVACIESGLGRSLSEKADPVAKGTNRMRTSSMTPEKNDHLKRKLNELAAELRAALSADNESAPVALDTAIGRLTRMDAIQSQQMALALKQRQQNQLLRVEKALKAIEQGTYGQCRKCGEPIAEERLEIQRDALFCMACALATQKS